MTVQELETVASYVKDHLPDWLERSPATAPSDYLRLGERIVRVEEGLLRVEEAIKNQNLLMEKRFEDLTHQMDKRFEDLTHQMDKRFEDLIHMIDKRFESVDKRFGWSIAIMGVLATVLGVLVAVV